MLLQLVKSLEWRIIIQLEWEKYFITITLEILVLQVMMIHLLGTELLTLMGGIKLRSIKLIP